MKSMNFAAAAGVLLLAGAAQAKPVGNGDSAITAINVTASSSMTRPAESTDRMRVASSTGLPSYEMRSDGLMINGLLPANGWEG